LVELQKNKETIEQNNDFLYSSTRQIVQELKGQLEYAQKESINALFTWIKTFNDMRRSPYVKSANSSLALDF